MTETYSTRTSQGAGAHASGDAYEKAAALGRRAADGAKEVASEAASSIAAHEGPDGPRIAGNRGQPFSERGEEGPWHRGPAPGFRAEGILQSAGRLHSGFGPSHRGGGMAGHWMVVLAVGLLVSLGRRCATQLGSGHGRSAPPLSSRRSRPTPSQTFQTATASAWTCSPPSRWSPTRWPPPMTRMAGSSWPR